MNSAPNPTMALVTWKFPEPTTPNTCRAPSAVRTRPTMSATRIGLMLDEREDPAGRAGTGHDRQRPGEHQRAGRRQLGQVLQLGQAVLLAAEQERVARERRVERVRGTGVGADRLHADALDRRLLG